MANDINELRRILREHTTIAVVGLSAEWHRPSYFAAKYMQAHGYRIVPVVALVDPAAPLLPDPAEVEAAFEVPLDFLMDEANHQRHHREFRGTLRHF